jgi:lipoprotein signal peptidase
MRGTRLIRRILWLLALIMVIVLLDQSVKRLMVDWIGPHAATHRVELVGSLVAFEYLENRGAAFGMFQQGTAILTLVSLVIVAVAFVFMVRVASDDFALAVCIGLIVGGAVGNAWWITSRSAISGNSISRMRLSPLARSSPLSRFGGWNRPRQPHRDTIHDTTGTRDQ